MTQYVCVPSVFLPDIIGKTSSVTDNSKAKFIWMHLMQIKTMLDSRHSKSLTT